jgi:SAM-dependent methyltransferase
MSTSELVAFQCNICGTISHAAADQFGRETRNCSQCGCTVRWRSVIYALSTELFKESFNIPEFPERKELLGIGMSDWVGYATGLSKSLNYTNTFYDCDPKLDICKPPSELECKLDFVICSDVLEHVAPPVSTAFRGIYRLLKPGGFAIITVPFTIDGDTIEHFPDLFEYTLSVEGETRLLKNRTRDGQEQEFRDLFFHGGSGWTLEMRRFSRRGLIYELLDAGFNEFKLFDEDFPKAGIFWSSRGSVPIAVRKSKAAKSAFIRAEFNSVPADVRNSTTTIIWDTADGTVGEIYVSCDGGPEKLFSRRASGSQQVSWINSNHAYHFRLYRGTSRSEILGSVKVGKP